MLGFSRDLMLGRHLSRPDVACRRVDEVVIRGQKELPIQIDGDVVEGASQARIRLAPHRLRVLML